ncbi:FAD-dependent pyridine nucleotide-disulfide oxidoreductase [Cyanobacterium stanieri PCC 7202]|uniref:FAD-dependent pyridine nucleotide-disulfide oxidoreductase n=1 Tax=Cyanobacterium stanieri (strain ATCC 29140 / PCC 7202) TaxID=292563 RepID=K9YNG1_CYASC|nr:FAD-dependent pyridine nucleotide-disulfide oxidoreductase [Cyanobacterium stanieri PCC 7202]
MMKLKYDLILLGGSLEAMWGAKYAANLGARVALVIDIDFDTVEGEKYLFQQLQNELLYPDNFHNRKDILEQKKLLIKDQLLPELESLEVDLIFSDFQFIVENKQTAIKTQKDILIANGYIITTPLYDYQPPSWQGMEEINYLTGYDIFEQWDMDSLPDNVLVIGDDVMAVNLAGLLIRHQKQVTLLTSQKHLLPTEDEDIAFLIQCHLESLGVRVLNDYPVSGVKGNWIQAGNKIIKCDQVIISDGFLNRKVSFDFNNLKRKKSAIFNQQKNNIIVNEKLQTDNNTIYCVGDLLGGYSNLTITEKELRTAIDNILFLPQNTINYDLIPYKVNISSGVFRVGYSESQVRDLYGDSWQSFVVQDSFLSSYDVGYKNIFLKVLLGKEGNILGVHGWGYGAELLVNIFAVIMGENNHINNLLRQVIADDFVRQVINNLQEMIVKKRSRYIIQFLESWFIWKRV